MNQVDSSGMTPMIVACMEGNVEVIRTLAELGADVNAYGGKGEACGLTPFHVAVEGCKVGAMKALCALGADVNAAMGINWRTPLHGAAGSGTVLAIKTLATLGADMNVVMRNGQNPVHIAAQQGHVNAIKVLIERGSLINARDAKGRTPFFIAALYGHANCIRALAERGADVNTITNTGYTPMMKALQEGHEDVVKALVKLGEDINAVDSNNSTPLAAAIENDHIGLMRVLVKLGADVNAYVPSHDNCPVIFHAAKFNKTNAILALAKLGAQVNVSRHGYTPLGIAVKEENAEAVKALVASGADVVAPQDLGCTCLILATKHGNLEIIRTLVEHGADLNTKNLHDGFTAVLTAAFNGHDKAVNLLYKLGANMVDDELSLRDIAQSSGKSKVIEIVNQIMEKLNSECEFCGSSSKRLKVCSRCKDVRYCSRDCQVQDYKKHKKKCKVHTAVIINNVETVT